MSSDPQPASPRRSFVIRAALAVARFFAALWNRIRPDARVRRAVSMASVAVVLAYGGFAGSRLHTTLGWWADIGIGVGIALVAVLFAPLAFGLVQLLGRALSHALGVFGAGALVAFAFLLDETAFSIEVALLLAPVVIVPLALWVGALASMTRGDFGSRRWFTKAAVVLFCVVGLLANGAFVWWAVHDGSAEHLKHKPVAAVSANAPRTFAGESPAEPGQQTFEVLTYGSGKDRHRHEFGAGVALTSGPVNGRPFVQMPKGWKGDVRERYCGFDAGSLPLNGTVWCPAGDGPFPLVLCVHGNHGMYEWSDPGYAYLGELCASRGFLFVSVDENFLNSGGKALGSMRKENDARAWVLLEHLALWRKWNETADHRFSGRVDLDKVALIGHSRGGEAVCLAAVFNRLRHYPDDASVRFDYGFGIRGVISIAPVDGQYRAADHDTTMLDVNYFTIHGGHDADVSQFHGDRFYRRAAFTERGEDCFKSSLWIYRANHGQFNTVWGAYDSSPPRAWLLNDAALMSGEDQRQIAKVFLVGFLEATLNGRDEYRALFRDPRSARNLVPEHAILIGRYEDPSFRVVADFEEDVDVTTTSVPGGLITATGFAIWREKDIPLRDDGKRRDHGVELGWDNTEPDEADQPGEAEEPAAPQSAAPPVFELQLPDACAVAPTDVLVLAVAASDTKPKAKDYSEPAPDEEDDNNDAATDDDEDSDEEETEEDRVARPIDISIELEDEAGATSRLLLSEFGVLVPPLDVVVRRDDFRTSKWETTFEPVLQTFRCPLAAFAREGFEPAKVAKIRLVFDVTEKGAVYVDRIGFAR